MMQGKWMVICIAGIPAAPNTLLSPTQAAYQEALFSDDKVSWENVPGAAQSDELVKSLLDRSNLDPLIAAGYRVLLISSESPSVQALNPLYQQFDCSEVRTLSDEEAFFASQLRIPRWEFRSRLYLPQLTTVVEDGVMSKLWLNIHNPPHHLEEVLEALI